MVCGRKVGPLDAQWLDSDLAILDATLQEMSERCSDCGTRLDEHIDENGRPSVNFEATMFNCRGCELLADTSKAAMEDSPPHRARALKFGLRRLEDDDGS